MELIHLEYSYLEKDWQDLQPKSTLVHTTATWTTCSCTLQTTQSIRTQSTTRQQMTTMMKLATREAHLIFSSKLKKNKTTL